MLYRTARLVASEQGDVNEVMCTKVFCTEVAGRVVDAAVQLAGGDALSEGHPLERLYREVRSMRFTEGASDVLRLNIARGRLELGRGIL
jgi:alkylation response protein AidB-like acyl-CoA dehydrogenase